MGVVYRAIDEKLHREVAIKVLHPHLLKHENLKERFRREARMHAKIIHPHIVTLLSLYEEGDHMALVMEMIHGKNLKDYLREHLRPDLTDVVHISEAILSGLDAAHKQGMVHRDLKPANVMLASNGDIKLMDFGLAKPKKHGDDDLTQSGATVGSYRYMAPEQILNQPADIRSDLYSFGILLYQMVTGKLPFDTTSNGGEFEIMEKQVRYNPVPPIEINSNMPVDLSDLIMRLLSKDKDSRPVNCEVVQRKLMEIMQQVERLRSHASQISKRPNIQPQQSSSDIAKGLIVGWSRRYLRSLVKAADLIHQWLWSRPVSKVRSLIGFDKGTLLAPERKHIRFNNSLPLKSRGIVVWGSIAVALVVLGWILTREIRLAERPIQHSAVNKAKEAEEEARKIEKAEPITAMENANNSQKESTQSMTKTTNVPVVISPNKKQNFNAVPKAHLDAEVKTKKIELKHKSTFKQKTRDVSNQANKLLPVTYKVSYKIVNSQADHINPNDPNEFRGSSRLYFKSLIDNKYKQLVSFHTGWVRLFFDQPIHLSEIKIHEISSGSLSFRGGSIELAVQDIRGHWTTLFKRKDRDIITPLIIRNTMALTMVKGVRLRFRSSVPLRVGPIDLLP